METMTGEGSYLQHTSHHHVMVPTCNPGGRCDVRQQDTLLCLHHL